MKSVLMQALQNIKHLILKLRSYEKFNLFIVAFLIIITIILYYAFQSSLPNYQSYWTRWFWPYFRYEFYNDFLGSLLNIPLIYCALTLNWKKVLIFWLCSVSLIVPYIAYFSFDAASLLYSVVFLTIPVAIIIFINLEFKWREKERKSLMEREAERKIYLNQIFKAQENERKRIAQELHDGITQTVLVIASRAIRLRSFS